MYRNRILAIEFCGETEWSVWSTVAAAVTLCARWINLGQNYLAFLLLLFFVMDGVGNEVGHNSLLLFEPEAVTRTVLRFLFWFISFMRKRWFVFFLRFGFTYACLERERAGTYTHARTHTCIHACARAHTHTHTHIHTHARTHARAFTHVHAHTRTHTHLTHTLHARARTHTHTHTHTHKIKKIARARK